VSAESKIFMINKIFYNKLVRDRIEVKIKEKGEACEIRPIADTAEFQQELLKKITEEASALSMVRTRAEFLDEYADLMVVLDALTAELEVSEADITVAMQENVARKGLYKKRHYLHWSADGDYTSNESPQGIKD
jgi:predicted house-cleaning noncanonical NTP pyrophosphatase (MazG superfamily)